MKIIICGASEVGSNIAKQLVYEDNDVTVIDESEVLLRSLSKNVDLKVFVDQLLCQRRLKKREQMMPILLLLFLRKR